MWWEDSWTLKEKELILWSTCSSPSSCSIEILAFLLFYSSAHFRSPSADSWYCMFISIHAGIDISKVKNCLRPIGIWRRFHTFFAKKLSLNTCISGFLKLPTNHTQCISAQMSATPFTGGKNSTMYNQPKKHPYMLKTFPTPDCIWMGWLQYITKHSLE